MSDLHFLQQLGTEFTRLDAARADGRRSGPRSRGRERAPRGIMAGVGLGLSVLVVIAVSVVNISVHGPGRSGAPAPSRVTVTLAAAINPRAGLGSAITRAVPILRTRLAAVPGVRVSRTAGGVAVTAPGGQSARARRSLSSLSGRRSSLASMTGRPTFSPRREGPWRAFQPRIRRR